MNGYVWRTGVLFIAFLTAGAFNSGNRNLPMRAFLDETADKTASAVRVPFRVVRGVILFKAMIDGHGPFDFAFDPGAHDTLTKDAAVALGLPSGTQSTERTLRIGGAELQHVSLPVYDGDPGDIFQTRANEPPIAGALGPQILNRFAVRIDYRAHALTLTPLETFVYAGGGVRVPFTIQDDNIPLVEAAVDGVPGIFQFDVRAPGTLFLFAPFLERSGLARRYPSGSRSVATLTLARQTLTGVTTRFGTSHSGKFGSSTEAGLLGYGVLRRFTTTIDYRHKVIYFEPT